MKNYLIYIFSFSILISCLSLRGQGHQTVFPGLEGSALEQALQEDFRPDSVLTYDLARDTLFKLIDSRNDTIYGIYSDLAIYLPPGQDPTTFLFMNGAANGINTEHSWPRSKGARQGNANSDMHHLFPSRTPVNSDRGSLPFGESEDSQTQKWYYRTQTQGSIPANRDLYSELGNGVFEPREASKGNIARACFYFYTIYREEAIQADPQFFEIQREALCQWHLDDPVDKEEWERSGEIAAYQDGKHNPFILDCTLAHRTYCQDYEECIPVSSTYLSTTQQIDIYPNPVREKIFFSPSSLSSSKNLMIQIFTVQGKMIHQTPLSQQQLNSGIEAPIHSGMYILLLTNRENGKQYVAKFMKL